jgi:hypothetical protein
VLIGFKHREIKIEVAKIIEKIKSYNMPNTWEDIVQLIVNKDQYVLKPI